MDKKLFKKWKRKESRNKIREEIYIQKDDYYNLTNNYYTFYDDHHESYINHYNGITIGHLNSEYFTRYVPLYI